MFLPTYLQKRIAKPSIISYNWEYNLYKGDFPMRSYKILNQAVFAKDGEQFSPVTLPHTWNALDGQDGGGDYFRGQCCYMKQFQKMDLT